MQFYVSITQFEIQCTERNCQISGRVTMHMDLYEMVTAGMQARLKKHSEMILSQNLDPSYFFFTILQYFLYLTMEIQIGLNFENLHPWDLPKYLQGEDRIFKFGSSPTDQIFFFLSLWSSQ